MVACLLPPEMMNFMKQICLAQAQECILEKSMLDNRKATIIAKVAVQVVDYYKKSLNILSNNTEDGSFADILGTKPYKKWHQYILFKVIHLKGPILSYSDLKYMTLDILSQMHFITVSRTTSRRTTENGRTRCFLSKCL